MAVEGDAVTLAGADVVDGTPVLDVKPYLPFADGVPGAVAPPWVRDLPHTAAHASLMDVAYHLPRVQAVTTQPFGAERKGILTPTLDMSVHAPRLFPILHMWNVSCCKPARCFALQVASEAPYEPLQMAAVDISPAAAAAISACWQRAAARGASLYASADALLALVRQVPLHGTVVIAMTPVSYDTISACCVPHQVTTVAR